MLVTGKDRPSRMPAVFGLLREDIARQRRKTAVTGCGCFGVLAAIGLLVALMGSGEDAFIVVFVLGIMGLVFGGIALGGAMGRIRAAEEKVAFAEAVHDQFLDDVHPAGKVHYHLDLRHYDVDDKRYWTGRSQHGNAKHRYDDRWYRSKFHLSDGSIVVIERRADVKTRKGAVVKNKRRLYLKIFPNPKTFGVAPVIGSDLEPMVKQTIRDDFHDPPEGLKVNFDAQRGEVVALRVTQLDADILGREVLVLVQAVLLYLRMRG